MKQLTFAWILLVSAGCSTVAVDREFEVAVDTQQAWAFLEQVETWPTWASHIRKVVLSTPQQLNQQTEGSFELSNDMVTTFKMTEYNPGQNWKWVGSFWWFDVGYDHQFTLVSPNRTKMRWVVELNGFLAPIIGLIFGHIYNGNLDVAIPRLQEQIKN